MKRKESSDRLNKSFCLSLESKGHLEEKLTSGLNSVNSSPRQSNSTIFWVFALALSVASYAFGPAEMLAECVFYWKLERTF
jgi:hypothetical protein